MIFAEGDRVRYDGHVWPTGITGTVLFPKGAEAYRVKLDKPHEGFPELTMLTKNLKRLRAEEPTVRARVLDEAKRITATDRNSAYGEPEDNFQRIADFWNVWLQDKLAINLEARDVPALMVLVKMAREMNAPKEDNKTDGAGYFACWAEIDAPKNKE